MLARSHNKPVAAARPDPTHWPRGAPLGRPVGGGGGGGGPGANPKSLQPAANILI